MSAPIPLPLPSPLTEVPIEATPFGGESTSAKLRRTEAELGSALSRLNRVTRELAATKAELDRERAR